jgi:nitroimidazol reductase NimA-like FMN-containing flavoprotein (pyridoxamine 5'-phosphate oxidase superfamily)
LVGIKIYKAMPNSPGMDQSEIDAFLASNKTPLRLGTTNSKGEPNIHPVWYHYVTNKLYFMSYKDAVKVRNLKQNSVVYFSVDTDAMPNRVVKGKGTAAIIKDTGKALSL